MNKIAPSRPISIKQTYGFLMVAGAAMLIALIFLCSLIVSVFPHEISTDIANILHDTAEVFGVLMAIAIAVGGVLLIEK